MVRLRKFDKAVEKQMESKVDFLINKAKKIYEHEEA